MMTRTTAPSAMNEIAGCATMKTTAYVGDSPSSTEGYWITIPRPAAASTANHSTITGPNSTPTLPVPKRWTAKRTTRITAAIGTIRCAIAGAVT